MRILRGTTTFHTPLHGAREGGLTIPNGVSDIARPGDDLLQKVVDLLEESSKSFKWLQKIQK